MAEITNIRPAFDVSPVLAGFIGAGVLVVSVSLAVFVWTCCHRRYQKSLSSGHGGDPGSDPPYKFIHMLKGISIYPETLSNSKKIVRVARRAGELRAASGNYRSDWAHNNTVLVDAAENGLLSPSPTQGSRPLVCPSQQRLEQQLPLRADYSQGLSPDPSLSSSTTGSKTPSPFTPSDGTEEAKLGTLSFSVDYNFPKKALVVTIQEAHGLPAVDEQASSSDPYIKMTILPEKKHRVKTRVLRKTLDPVFDETFTFYGVPFSGLQELVLHFLVLSFDRFSRDDVIGEVVVPLSGVDPSTGRVQLRHDIVKRNIQCVSRGELLVSLSSQPATHRLSVVVLKAKHLPKMDITGLSGNPYVKVNVYYGRKRIAKKKTHVKKCTLNPVFNESFIYDIPAELLPDISVEFLVIDFDRTTKNEVIGRLVLGAHSATPSGAAHWREVCENPRRQIAKWHSLGEY
ncbi:synaptotagmin-11a isoform X1 [Polypterus senegalus]|uniref:synaptotagmin-11a isoform X1 n=1 Tax=Polypterus senegalus TaxID=55291 RepID=UPI00196314AF|nr:synaptotagmin-11a isoform X1 [Polypterus senegalus]